MSDAALNGTERAIFGLPTAGAVAEALRAYLARQVGAGLERVLFRAAGSTPYERSAPTTAGTWSSRPTADPST